MSNHIFMLKILRLFSKREEAGFSIVEITVVIFIISVGLLGVMALNTRNLQVQNINKNDLIAAQLAQEGLELVRNIRDTNWLKGDDWKSGVGIGTNSDIVQDGDYTIDYAGNIVDIDGIDNAPLSINGSGFYDHGVGASSPFFRLISVVDQIDSLNITCTVRWRERGRVNDYKAETVLYNWK